MYIIYYFRDLVKLAVFIWAVNLDLLSYLPPPHTCFAVNTLSHVCFGASSCITVRAGQLWAAIIYTCRGIVQRSTTCTAESVSMQRWDHVTITWAPVLVSKLQLPWAVSSLFSSIASFLAPELLTQSLLTHTLHTLLKLHQPQWWWLPLDKAIMSGVPVTEELYIEQDGDQFNDLWLACAVIFGVLFGFFLGVAILGMLRKRFPAMYTKVNTIIATRSRPTCSNPILVNAIISISLQK